MSNNLSQRNADNTTANSTCTVIKEKLREIERSRDVTILFASEAGSRAWGFASEDSDYDVRFIYVHRPEWYLSIQAHRDVIETPIADQLDINGWELRKALRLFNKSNPPLLEWLYSPIVYVDIASFAHRLRVKSERFYVPRAAVYHYYHMAIGNIREYLKGDTVWRKKYLYCLRPLFAIRYIEAGLGATPVAFPELIAVCRHQRLVSDDVCDAATQLIEEKRSGQEMGMGPRIAVLNDYIYDEIRQREPNSSAVIEAIGGKVTVDEQTRLRELDNLFREMVSRDGQ